MNKKGELSYLALLGIVGVVALVGLVLISTNGSNGSTGKAVYVTGVDTATGQAKLVDVSQAGGLAGTNTDVANIFQQLPQPDWILTFPTGVGDASAFNKDGYVTDGVIFGGTGLINPWHSDFAVTARRTSLTTVSLIAVSGVHIHTALSDSAISGPTFSQLDIVAGTTGAHVIHIHTKNVDTGAVTVQRLRYVSSVHNELVAIWNDGIVGGTGVAGDVINPAVGVSS